MRLALMNFPSWPARKLVLAALACVASLATTALAGVPDAPELIKQKCGVCHDDNGKLMRIPDLRKTPEGWDMSIARMGIWHGVKTTLEERRVLVKHLADTQGLAPSETTAWRFIIERRPSAQDTPPDEELGIMCGRCHSFGRVALQRRDSAEWLKLMHTHMGQFPSIEFSAGGRDRKWWDIAREQIPDKLGKMFPLNTEAWSKWQQRPATDASGTWHVSGERPGMDRYTGTLNVSCVGKDQYAVKYDLRYANGKKVTGEGESLLYTGYEWRGKARLGNEETRSIFALSEDGGSLSGRWFLRDADEVGASLEGVKTKKGENAIVAVEPPMIRAGNKATVTVTGYGLDGKPDFGAGIKVLKVLKATAEQYQVLVQAEAKAADGLRNVKLGKVEKARSLALYHHIDAVRVEPDFALARVGGGNTPPVTAQFLAVAYLNGPDGKPGTVDDIRLGSVPAVWRADNFNDAAKEAEDAKFAGTIDGTGLFTPGPGGPNPKRKLNANNIGDLAVTAAYKDGAKELRGTGHLIVSVQRFNMPPLR